jgi:hypothetical protein
MAVQSSGLGQLASDAELGLEIVAMTPEDVLIRLKIKQYPPQRRTILVRRVGRAEPRTVYFPHYTLGHLRLEPNLIICPNGMNRLFLAVHARPWANYKDAAEILCGPSPVFNSSPLHGYVCPGENGERLLKQGIDPSVVFFGTVNNMNSNFEFMNSPDTSWIKHQPPIAWIWWMDLYISAEQSLNIYNQAR